MNSGEHGLKCPCAIRQHCPLLLNIRFTSSLFSIHILAIFNGSERKFYSLHSRRINVLHKCAGSTAGIANTSALTLRKPLSSPSKTHFRRTPPAPRGLLTLPASAMQSAASDRGGYDTCKSMSSDSPAHSTLRMTPTTLFQRHKHRAVIVEWTVTWT